MDFKSFKEYEKNLNTLQKQIGIIPLKFVKILYLDPETTDFPLEETVGISEILLKISSIDSN